MLPCWCRTSTRLQDLQLDGRPRQESHELVRICVRLEARLKRRIAACKKSGPPKYPRAVQYVRKYYSAKLSGFEYLKDLESVNFFLEHPEKRFSEKRIERPGSCYLLNDGCPNPPNSLGIKITSRSGNILTTKEDGLPECLKKLVVTKSYMHEKVYCSFNLSRARKTGSGRRSEPS